MPTVLPVTFPNLLVNGSMGVAWAMACSIPPHNTAEVLSAALLVLDDPDVSIDKLLKVMPGPDLPGGGIVVNPDNLRSIYETGRGTVLVQGRIEQLPGQQTLRITELPYQVSAKSIVEQAVQGAKDGKITEILHRRAAQEPDRRRRRRRAGQVQAGRVDPQAHPGTAPAHQAPRHPGVQLDRPGRERPPNAVAARRSFSISLTSAARLSPGGSNTNETSFSSASICSSPSGPPPT